MSSILEDFNRGMNTPTQSQPTDDAVLAQLARTDGDAFAELYNRHVPRVYRYHMAHTGNVKDAEDLTSQTFMAAMEGITAIIITIIIPLTIIMAMAVGVGAGARRMMLWPVWPSVQR